MGLALPRGMTLKHLATLLVLAVALVFPARVEATGRTHTRPAVTAIAKSPVAKAPSQRSLGSRADEDRYAQREKASNDAKKYRAGDVIVISATVAIIVLLGIIIILLIT